MANINIHVEELFVSPMSYIPFNIVQQNSCGPALQRNVRFDDPLGDFVVGRNFTNSAGFPAQILRIINFVDTSVIIQNSTGNETPAPGFVPRRLKNIVTNTVISTFPTDVPIANLNQLGVEVIGDELICPADLVNNSARRRRELTYRILDSNGNLGPVVTTQFDNTP
jgi:hypothetical protein